MSPAQPSLRPRQRLFWKIYRNGILLLFVVAILVAVAVHSTGHKPPWHETPRRLATMLAEGLERQSGGVQDLQRRLDEIHSLMRLDLAVFDASGQRLAEAGARPLTPLSPDQLTALDGHDVFHSDGRLQVALPLRPGDTSRGVLIMGFDQRRSLLGMLAILAAVLFALAVASYPLARALVRPMDQLTATARELAAGKLDARTGLVRKDELGVLAATMDHMAERLEHKIRSEKELLANISHEIRTPLARLKVALELLEDGPAEQAAVIEKLSGMSADVSELDDLVERVLIAARMDLAGDENDPAGFVPRLQELDLAHLVDAQSARFLARYPGRELEINLAPDLPVVSADPELLGRVLSNLLDNSARYGESDQPISLTAEVENLGLKIQVRDKGQGVAPDDLPRLFDPFFRAESSRDRKAGGVGLGLTLCQRIVQAHGGAIQASSPDGKGLAIDVVLPLKD